MRCMSQVDEYRAKANEYARLTLATKSLREGRRYRKLGEMYQALALGKEPEKEQPSNPRRRAQRDYLSIGVSSTSCAEMGAPFQAAQYTGELEALVLAELRAASD